MNTITATPRPYGEIITTNRKTNINFTGGKTPKANQVKEAGAIFKRFYQAFFVPGREKVSGIKGPNVYTREEVKEGAKIISKKYNLWSRKPIEIVEDNCITKHRQRTIMNPDGTMDFELRDMHAPEYKVSVRYGNVERGESKTSKDIVNGVIKLNYGEKEITLSQAERDEMRQKLSDTLSKKYDNKITQLMQKQIDGQQFFNEYYHDSDVIAFSILESPTTLKRQLKTVPSSMPYGIEAIIERIGK